MSEFKTILVKGGFSGKKLHRANNGSSSLSCGHWTKTAVTRFQVADNVSDETLKKFHDDGYEMCEKCFPQFAEANADKPKAYSGPKWHMNNNRPRIVNGEVKGAIFQGTACGRGGMYANPITYNDFSKLYKESPDQCCKGCVKRFLDLKVKVKQMRESLK